MEVDSENESLHKIAAGGEIDEATWLDLRADFIARLDKLIYWSQKIARNDFPIPKLPPPPPAPTIESRLLSPLPSSPLEQSSSQEAKKENAPPEQADEEPRHLAPGELPKQLDDMLADIKKHLDTFESHAPHTIQRLMELLLRPKAHYKALAPYLHALDRVVRVTSETNTYPLPPAVPDMSSMELNGDDARDAAAANVSWSNPTVAALGTDEALGGALLTPIPWLTRRSPEDNDGEATPTPTTPVAGAQIHSEATETIDGPNGAGSVETVSVSVNGIPSTGHHTRGVTQGELLRQEQRAGVVPVSQLTRAQEYSVEEEAQQQQQQQQEEEEEQEEQEEQEGEEEEEEEEEEEDDDSMDQANGDEVPRARGPEEIGVGDTGLQGVTTSHMSEDGGVSMQGIDVEAAVGRKHDEHDQTAARAARAARDDDASSTSSTESTGTKREAQQELEGEHAKKMKEETAPLAGDADEEASPSASASTAPEEKKDGHGDGEEDGAKAEDMVGSA
ncbi:hypothetical protein EsDP_00000915 [Epichloe bromicola]|uniref:PPP4R2-domain-containing protein n=1 Tax=Epichloe bromicola TaxID=79588 RepID=A0ABQ0CGE1_9HYPO